MTEQEKKMIDKLSQSEQNVEIPETLQPKNLEKTLKDKEKKTVGKNWWRQKKFYGILAASLVLVVGLGVFTMGQKQEQKNNDGGMLEMGTSLAHAEAYEDVYECLENYQRQWEKEETGFPSGLVNFFGGSGASDYAVEESASADKGSSFAAGSSGYSDTNVRTEGVGEADTVKTDGKYLYVLKDSCMEVAIIDAQADHMQEIGKIRTEKGAQISEFYVKDNRLFLFTTISKTEMDEDGYEIYAGSAVQVETYDISDVKNPKQIGKTEQSGQFHTSRMVGNYIYTFSDYDVYEFGAKEDVDEYIPLVNGKNLPAEDIYLPAVRAACQYVVITAIDAKEPGQIKDQIAVLTDYGSCYVSNENIYIYENPSRVDLLRAENQSDRTQTTIRKISYKDGILSGVAQGNIDGWINDSFSIDEYEKNLRVVTTIEGRDTTTNAVYVLDEKLECIGKIDGIAKDERVYSARLFGEIGYFVTYRETDPLFSVDFSDPKNPKIIGKLKIPGFSEYLHFFGDDKLVGIGIDTNEETGITNGLKVSMFDISDPKDVKEEATYMIEDMYGSDLFYDYKAVLVDAEKNIIGFSGYNVDEEYYIFSYEEGSGFALEMQETVNGGSYMSTRGLYIGERFYVIKGNAIESYRLGTFEKIDDLLL